MVFVTNAHTITHEYNTHKRSHTQSHTHTNTHTHTKICVHINIHRLTSMRTQVLDVRHRAVVKYTYT